MTRLIHGKQHSQHPKKHKRQPETRKQVNQWMVEDSRVERNRIDKKKKSEEKGKSRCLD